MPAVVDPQSNELILRGRVKNVGDLIGAHQTLWWADLQSNVERTRAQQWRDGMAPYSAANEQMAGLGGRANVNWGLGDQIAIEAEMPYFEILDSIDNLCSIPVDYGTPEEAIYYQQVIEDEFTRMVRDWPEFVPLWQQCARLFVNEGVAFAFFDDDHTWQWDIRGLQDIKFPRRTRADINRLDIVTAQINMAPRALFRYCSNPYSEEQGWNKNASIGALKTSGQQWVLPSNDWQEWEKAYKDNDFILGVTNVELPTVHGWVQEVDGTVSHYIARYDGQGEFLYKREGKYRSMSNMLVPFLYGVGANGCLHSIRGVLQKTFAAGMGINKLFCRALDTAIHECTPFLSSPDENTISEMPLTPMGQYGVLKPGFSFVETKVPNFQQSLQPIMQMLMQFQNSRSSSYTSATPSALDSSDRTKYEKQMQYEQQGKLSTGGMSLFKNGLTMLWKEVVRRVTSVGYSINDPGGAYVQKFLARCLKRNVPLKAIHRVDLDAVEANLGIGKGSATERRTVVDALNTLVYQRADAKGQNLLNNWITGAYAGAKIANLVFPPQPGLRPPQDAEDAQNENGVICTMAILQQPPVIQVLPNQNDAVHLQMHISRLQVLSDALQTASMDLASATMQMSELYQHSIEHLNALDPTSPQTPMFKDSLEQFNQAITNNMKHLESERQKAQRELEHNQKIGAGTDGLTIPEDEHGSAPSALVQLAQASEHAKIVQEEQSHTIKLEKEAQSMSSQRAKDARDDALTAAKIQQMTRP